MISAQKMSVYEIELYFFITVYFIERLLSYVANSEIEFSYGVSGSAKGELFSAITRADKNMYLMKRRRSTSRGRKPARAN